MTNSETKNFSQNVSSSYHLRGEYSNECKKDSLNVPKLRFKGYNDEWKQNKLGNLFEIKASGDIDNKKLSKNKNEQYKYPVYANALQNNGLYGYSDIYKISGETITVTGRGDVGHAIARKENYYPIVRLLILKPIVKQDVDFWANAINNTRIFVESTGVPQLTAPQLAKIKIYYPSLHEQEKIASFLTLIDKKIEKQKELVELLKKYKRGLLSQIFSQKLRFKDKNGNNYPDWEEKRLGDICTTFSGGTPSVTHQEYYNGEIPFIKSGEIHSDKTEMFITDIGLKNSSAKLVKKGDLLFALYGATSGEVDISKINGAINQAILCVQSDTLNLNYLKELLSYNKNKILCKYLQGGQGNLSADIFKSLKFKFPTKKEQDKISDFLINYDKITNIEEDLLNLYINYKQGLLQQLFI